MLLRFQTPPALPPKNQPTPPPPLVIPRSSSASSRLSTTSSTHFPTTSHHSPAKSDTKSKTETKNETDTLNLIDFIQSDDENSVRVSILKEFDPLSDSFSSSTSSRAITPDCSGKLLQLELFLHCAWCFFLQLTTPCQFATASTKNMIRSISFIPVPVVTAFLIQFMQPLAEPIVPHSLHRSLECRQSIGELRKR